jgi:hypothetical protein
MIRTMGSFLAGVLLLAVAARAGDVVHPRLKEELQIQSVTMLPPVVELAKAGVKGSEGMGKEAEQASAEFASGVSTALVNRGLKVESPFTEDALKNNDELKYAVADVQKRFDEIADQLYKKHKDIRKGRFSLGDSVALLNTTGTSQALVILRSSGVQLTKGKAFMSGGLLGMAIGSKQPMYQTRVALVDAKNGDILFLGEYQTNGLPKDKTYEKSFQNIPVAK